MGEPAVPTPAERAATLELAKALVESVRNGRQLPDEFWLITSTSMEHHLFRLAQDLVNVAAERQRLRLGLARQSALRDGAVHCEHATCAASIDLRLIADSAWDTDERGWWFCPMHQPEVSNG